LVPIAFGENSELYRKLVLQEQKVDVLETSFEDQVDPELFAVFARVKNPRDIDYVRGAIQGTFDHFSKELIPQDKLDQTRSHIRYGTALGWQSAGRIAGFLASYIGLTGTPDTVNRLFALYNEITPKDVLDNARRYFTPDNQIVITLDTKREEKK
jgi:zinc protease